MFLLEKSLIGSYCNKLYDLKQTAQAKISMSPILIRKRNHQIVEQAYHQTAYFFMS